MLAERDKISPIECFYLSHDRKITGGIDRHISRLDNYISAPIGINVISRCAVQLTAIIAAVRP